MKCSSLDVEEGAEVVWSTLATEFEDRVPTEKKIGNI